MGLNVKFNLTCRLEYLVGGATVAVGWSGYLVTFHNSINELLGIQYKFDARFVSAPIIWLEKEEKYPWNSTLSAVNAGFYNNLVINPGILKTLNLNSWPINKCNY
jgi:hypothetical protein